MDARDYNLCLSADHNDVVIARNHGLGFYDNRTVTGEFLWVCEQLGYVKERTCKNVDDDDASPWFTCSSCGETTSTEWFCAGFGQGSYCPNCGAKVIGD